MKKVLFTLALAMTGVFAFGQSKTEFKTGTVLIETGSSTLDQRIVPTGLGYYSVAGGQKSIAVGAQAGYFIADNLAIKGGLGYANTHRDGKTIVNSFGYNVGAEYYFFGVLPLQVLWSGATIKGFDKNASYVSTQLGYAYVVGKHLVLKPVVRYDHSTDNYWKNGWGAGFQIGYKF